MRSDLRNLVIATIAVPVAYVAMHLFGRIWAHLFIDGRSFSVYFGVVSALDILHWAFYFVFFCIFWCSVSGLLRTKKPYMWAFVFGFAVYLLAEATTTYIVFADGVAETIYFFTQRASVLSSIVAGCFAGAFVLQRFRAVAPNHSLKRPHQSLRD